MAASTDSTLSIFQTAVQRVLGSWTVLQLAVQHGFGGRESQAKAEWLPGAISTWFSENDDIETDELEDFLTDVLDAEFTTVADDGSLPEIARKICGYWRLCQSGKEVAVLKEVESLPQADTSSSRRHNQGNEDSDEDDDDGQEPPMAVPIQPRPPASSSSTEREEAPMEEDDGWTVVQRTKNR